MTSTDVIISEKNLILETGLIAKQADGSVVARYGDTMVLATAVASRTTVEGKDFFPLTIDYIEKAYAAGKIPGGFLKREGRLSEKEVLTSRLIDRPIRPLFKKGFNSETQGIVSVLSYGDENIADILGITAISAALLISDIPFEDAVAAVRVGRLDGNIVINPGFDEMASLDLALVVAGTADAVTMVEGGGFEIPEDVLVAAIDRAHEEIKKIIGAQNLLREKVGKPKRAVAEVKENEALAASVKESCIAKMQESIRIPDKLKRQKTLDGILDETIKHLTTADPEVNVREIAKYFEHLEQDLVRNSILNEGIRADGRGTDEVRKIDCHLNMLPRAHGSALFVRGETQALVAVTLGTSSDEQRVDSLDGDTYKSFMLHYNFPPFSVGEVKPLRSPGRREIGHGALAERSIKAVLPGADEFPYTIRIVSDILESNGSSSMASVCGSTLALMDAGVPIKAPVAGIAMGLIKEGEKVVVLTDILGLEDHFGDMDFKVSGTTTGITAFQMDVKIKGVSREIMIGALEKARLGRLHILGKISEAIAAPRADLSKNAPRIFQMKIKAEKIKDVIGSGGKVIKGIIEQTGVKIDINDEGIVTIASNDEASLSKARAIVEGIVEDAQVGRIYTGKVKKIMDFGAFVEILPGTDGLLHISQISDKRVNKVTDELKEDDEVVVKVIEIDRAGKIKLSRKEAMKDAAKQTAT
ncbi:polynucleotide phosphorylase/polyadenylase [Candidatus Magnetominusculus xianensis]|uniref:Polyribonucleotide nucleotidyltransferase n=1 Tax=Candidatus Magnetominusculus xianensis TaxID=1748249 RepID=A0ABR5SNL9_9BACT|nr:polyribonucleotide nucleotidyltransferase [Candidatus Magnetominusculus xianensis]KWT95089.1 polynucleotide phosphorylase/polyadenylase [Candidatus Magnetominusculus xianensis]MBF0402737.1 polyribonucleotide nucleotidyltransferase [Nitrospirota bacterium]